jgi:hypothetical protein
MLGAHMRIILALLLSAIVSYGFAETYKDHVIDGEMTTVVDSDGWLWGPPLHSDTNQTGLIAIPTDAGITLVVFSQDYPGDQAWTVIFGNETHMVGSMSNGPVVLPVSKEDLVKFSNGNGFVAASTNHNIIEIPADYIKLWLIQLEEFEEKLKEMREEDIKKRST